MASPERFLSQEFTTNNFKFPENLGSNQLSRFMKITVYSFYKESINTPEEDRPGGSVCLPIPAAIVDENGYQYTEDEGNFVQRALESDSMVNQASSEAGNAVDYVKGNAAAIVAGVGDVDVGLRSQGKITNPRARNQFSGIGFKTHTFNWKMIAKNPNEMDNIANIVAFLKYHSAPIEEGVFISRPDKFDIQFIVSDTYGANASDTYLYRIGKCALENISVTYNGSGNSMFFRNTNAPVEVDLSMSFKEDSIAFRNRIKYENQQRGVYSGQGDPRAVPPYQA